MGASSQHNEGASETVLEPFFEQAPFLSKEKKYYGYVSGVGAGKTFAGILRTALNIQKWNPGEMGAIVAPTRTMVQDVIISEMRDLGLLDHWEFKSSYSDEPGIHAPNGSRALILSADNKKTIERLRGLNLAWWWMDEESIIDPRAREILMQRLRTGEYRNGYITTTPKGRNHTYDFFVGDHDTEEYAHGDGTIYESGDRLAITGVPSWANPHTPEDYHEAMGDLPDEVRAQEVEGNFVEIGAGVFSKDMLSFVRPGDLPERSFSYVMGVDVGVEADNQKARDNDSDYWAVTLGAKDGMSGTLYIIDIHRDRGMSLKQGVDWIAGLVPEGTNPKIFVESNQSQRWLKQELRDTGLNAMAVMNTTNKEERLIQLTIPLERGDVQFLNRGVDKSLGYDPRYQELVSEMLAFPEGGHDDMLDSLEILVDNVSLGSYNIMGSNPTKRDMDDG